MTDRSKVMAREATGVQPSPGSKDVSKRGGKGRASRPALPAVNLLSPWVLERIAVRRLRKRFFAGGVALLLLVGLGWGLQHLRVGDAEQLLAVEQGETARLSEQTAVLTPVRTFVAGVEQQKATVKDAMAREVYVSAVMEALQDAAPAGVRLESVVVTMAPEPVEAPAAAGGTTEGGTEEAPAEGAAGTTAPTVSPCPGPDPFNTRTVVGCITVAGTAASRAQVGDFVIGLGNQRLFVEPFITTTTTADRAQVNFDGSVGLSEKAFSGRYAKIDKLLAQGSAR